MDYRIEPNSRRCAATGRELQPGERYYTALLEQDHALVRQDFSTEAWQGPPTGAFSFWRGKVPPSQEASKPRFNDDLLEDCFLQLDGTEEPGKVAFRYVVALLLMRRRRYKLDETFEEGGVEKMRLKHSRTGASHEVVHPHLSEEEILQVQDDVFQVLGWK